MNCDRVRILLHGFLDGELDLANSLEIEEHLESCLGCSQVFAGQNEQHSLFARYQPALYHPASSALRQKVRTSLRKANGIPPTWLALTWRQGAAVGLLAILLVVVAGLGVTRLFPSPSNRLAQEVQAAHVRSLMADHLVDIVSTDQHTVKPWFAGRLDFSPPVVDLAANGFRLLGGRLDYLDSRPTAALVYQYNQHIVNLFIWPDAGPVQVVHAETISGYNLVQWSQYGMAYAAISDLNPVELKNFTDLVQANIK